jgi:hypothetical protein
MAGWESDQLIILGERESRSQGEGADVIRSQQRKHWPGIKDRTTVQTSLLGIAKKAKSDSGHSSLAAEASIHEEPGAGKPHAGICAGAVG